jgi:hypothetical protein
MAVETQIRAVREVGAELEKERPEIASDGIDIVMG